MVSLRYSVWFRDTFDARQYGMVIDEPEIENMDLVIIEFTNGSVSITTREEFLRQYTPCGEYENELRTAVRTILQYRRELRRTLREQEAAFSTFTKINQNVASMKDALEVQWQALTTLLESRKPT